MLDHYRFIFLLLTGFHFVINFNTSCTVPTSFGFSFTPYSVIFVFPHNQMFLHIFTPAWYTEYVDQFSCSVTNIYCSFSCLFCLNEYSITQHMYNIIVVFSLASQSFAIRSSFVHRTSCIICILSVSDLLLCVISISSTFLL